MIRPRWQVAGLLALTAILATSPTSAHAYIGPGAGLGLIGSFVAVALALVVAVFGLVLFPARLILRRLRQSSRRAPAAAAEPSRPGHG